MRALFFFALAVMLAGCGSLVQAQNACSNQNPSYLSMWGCIKGKVADNQAGMMNNDLGLRYLAYGDLLAERVRGQQMTDFEAKSLLARELSSANGEFEARKSAAIQDIAAIASASRPAPKASFDCTTRRVGNTLSTNCN